MRSLSCRKVSGALVDLLGGEAPTTSSQAVLRHLSQCADCLTLYEELSEVVRSIRGLEVPEPPESHAREFLPELERRIAASSPAPIAARWAWIGGLRPLVPGALLAALLYFAFPPARTGILPDPAVISASIAEQALALSDALDRLDVPDRLDLAGARSLERELPAEPHRPLDADVFGFFETAAELDDREASIVLAGLEASYPG